MVDLMKKGLMLGLGIGVMTKEAIEKTVKELEKKGTVNAVEGKKMVEDIIKKSEKHNKQMKKMVDARIQEAIKKSPFATKKELNALTERINKLSGKKKKK